MIELERVAHLPDATFGLLRAPELEVWTVERPWFNNVPRVSCIPVGTYQLAPTVYNRGGYQTYELLNVPGRSLIKIHAANLADQLQGCIAPGLRRGLLEGQWAVTSSRDALNQLLAVVNDMAPEDRVLTIFNKEVT